MEKGWAAKLAEAESRSAAEEARKAKEAEARASGRPQILNLNEDGMLDRKVFFDLSEHKNATVGRKGSTVELGGVGI